MKPESMCFADEKMRARFTREAQASAGLSHPNVVTIHDFGFDQGNAYLVMEHLPGPGLGTLVKMVGPLPITDAVRYLRDAAAGSLPRTPKASCIAT